MKMYFLLILGSALLLASCGGNSSPVVSSSATQSSIESSQISESSSFIESSSEIEVSSEEESIPEISEESEVFSSKIELSSLEESSETQEISESELSEESESAVSESEAEESSLVESSEEEPSESIYSSESEYISEREEESEIEESSEEEATVITIDRNCIPETKQSQYLDNVDFTDVSEEYNFHGDRIQRGTGDFDGYIQFSSASKGAGYLYNKDRIKGSVELRFLHMHNHQGASVTGIPTVYVGEEMNPSTEIELESKYTSGLDYYYFSFDGFFKLTTKSNYKMELEYLKITLVD